MIAWLYFYRLLRDHPWLTAKELALIEEGHTKGPKAKIRWVELLQIRHTWGLFLARFFSSPVWWFYLFWLPKYLVDQRGFTMQQVGMLAWMPYLAADLGSISGGFLSGYLVKKGWMAMRARSAIMLPFALVMPLSLVIAYTQSTVVAMTVICIVAFSHMAWMTNLVTVTNDIYPVRVVGSVSGIAAFGNGLGGAVFTWLTGQIVQQFSYGTIFVIMGFLHPAAYALFRLLVRGQVETFGEAQLVEGQEVKKL
jgi:ACS family hexuronate transporter-like MFS transporter